MSEPGNTPQRATAGALLRAAREKQGLHIAALAAAIKVAPRKLDALENDRYDELPDATFTRALAQTICRTLKIDAHPILGLLPVPESSMLDHVGGTLNTPFKERSSREEAPGLAVAAIRPMVWAGVVLLVAAVAVYLAPDGLLRLPSGHGSSEPAAPLMAASAPVAEGGAPAPVLVEAPAAVASEAPAVAAAASLAASSVPATPAQVAAAPAVPPASATAPAPAPAPAPAVPGPAAVVAAATPSLVQVQTVSASWVEARDARGRVVFSRLVQPGEPVAVDGDLPLRVVVGNAPATRVIFRGQPVDLAPLTRSNVARFELQ